MVEIDTHTFIENRIEVEDSKRKVDVYPIDIHDGGIKIKVVDKVSFPPYVLKIPIKAKNTRWSKQPPLTQKEIDEGTFRPENVVNSYAVYHATKKHNQYGTGKIFHWYQTKVIDVEGNWAWCDTEVDRYIDPTEVTITAPTEFMERAVYPVTWDPDLGYTLNGGTDYNICSGVAVGDIDRRRGSAWTMTATGTTNYIRAYVRAHLTDHVDCKVFINQKDSGGAGTHGQIETDENLGCVDELHWEEFTLGGADLTNGVTYILSIMGDKSDVGAASYYYLRGDVDGAIDSYLENQIYGAPENPWVVGAEGTTIDYSIYCNYTVPAPPPVEEGGLRMTLSLKGHEGWDCKTRGGKARRRVF